MYYNFGTIMPLFSLTDITFSGSSRTGSAATNLAGSGYGYNILRYPSDLGNYDKGHYILLHINEQKLTQVGTYEVQVPTASEATTAARNAMVGSTTTGQNLNNIVTGLQDVGSVISDKLTSAAGNIFGEDNVKAFSSFLNENLPSSSTSDSGFMKVVSGTINTVGSLGTQAVSGQGLRTTRRTIDTVALYMPDTLAFNDTQSFGELNMGQSFRTGLMSGVSGAIETYRAGGGAEGISKNFSPFLYDALTSNPLSKGLLGDSLSSYLFAASGLARNPMMEVLYSSPQLRTFRFDFMFYPRSEAEAKEVYDIIERIRFHQAPEFKANSGGYYLIPPSEFDIKFMYNGMENPNIPKIIGSCVLESVDLDYAPNGFAAYESVGENKPTKGGTGTPVATRMSLTFKETTIVTKQDFETGQKRFEAIGYE